jgi:hypothetical protein
LQDRARGDRGQVPEGGPQRPQGLPERVHRPDPLAGVITIPRISLLYCRPDYHSLIPRTILRIPLSLPLSRCMHGPSLAFSHVFVVDNIQSHPFVRGQASWDLLKHLPVLVFTGAPADACLRSESEEGDTNNEEGESCLCLSCCPCEITARSALTARSSFDLLTALREESITTALPRLFFKPCQQAYSSYPSTCETVGLLNSSPSLYGYAAVHTYLAGHNYFTLSQPAPRQTRRLQTPPRHGPSSSRNPGPHIQARLHRRRQDRECIAGAIPRDLRGREPDPIPQRRRGRRRRSRAARRRARTGATLSAKD